MCVCPPLQVVFEVAFNSPSGGRVAVDDVFFSPQFCSTDSGELQPHSPSPVPVIRETEPVQKVEMSSASDSSDEELAQVLNMMIAHTCFNSASLRTISNPVPLPCK